MTLIDERTANLDRMAEVITAIVVELGPIRSRELVDVAVVQLGVSREQAKFGLNHAAAEKQISLDPRTWQLSAVSELDNRADSAAPLAERPSGR